jgi:hypothetical protein
LPDERYAALFAARLTVGRRADAPLPPSQGLHGSGGTRPSVTETGAMRPSSDAADHHRLVEMVRLGVERPSKSSAVARTPLPAASTLEAIVEISGRTPATVPATCSARADAIDLFGLVIEDAGQLPVGIAHHCHADDTPAMAPTVSFTACWIS